MTIPANTSEQNSQGPHELQEKLMARDWLLFRAWKTVIEFGLAVNVITGVILLAQMTTACILSGTGLILFGAVGLGVFRSRAAGWLGLEEEFKAWQQKQQEQGKHRWGQQDSWF